MNKTRIIFFFLLLGGCITNLFAQGNAYIRRDTLLQVLPGYTSQVNTFDSLKTAFGEELKMEQQKLEKKANALFAAYNPKSEESTEALLGRMSQVDISRYNLLQKESALLDERGKSYNQILETHYKQKVQPLIEKLNKVIETYALKNKYDMIFILEDIAPALAYVNKGKDVTLPIIQLIQSGK